MQVEEFSKALLGEILPVVDKNREGICIDIGVGTFVFYCEFFSQWGFKTVAVEPLPIEELRQICERQAITLIEGCVADVNGVKNLYIGTFESREDFNLSSLVPDWWGASNTSIEVPSITLLHLLERISAQKITCLKIDIEGAESLVISQFRDLPEVLKPRVVMFEYGGGNSRKNGEAGWSNSFLNSTLECLRILQDSGYGLSVLIDSNESTQASIFDLKSCEIEADNIFSENSVWGNIISIYDKGSSLSYGDLKKSFSHIALVNVIENLIGSRNIVFDIGANVGWWTKEVLKHRPDVQIHLFEPVPKIYQSLLQSLSNYFSTNNLSFNNYALGNKTGIQKFYWYVNASEWSTFYRRLEIEKPFNLETKQLNILTTTLDEYAEQMSIDHINFIKIDVEGGELSVLQGAKQLLKKGRIDYIQFEYGGTYQDAKITLKSVFDYLQGFGYELLKILPTGIAYIPQFLPEYETFEYSDFLAVNGRFRSRLVGEPPKMFDLPELCEEHAIVPRGIIHIGAYEGAEISVYQAMGIKKVLFVEANPAVFQRLQFNVAHLPEVQVINCAISNFNGKTTLHVTSLDQSSSILPLKEHREIYPDIQEVRQISVDCKTLDTLLQELQLDPAEFNLLNIDIQGAELLALQGSHNTLSFIEAINTEVNYVELYENSALVDKIDDFLELYGFDRVATTTPFHPSWGDAFYVKRPLVTMSTLGINGRFANQIFQYAFLKIYAKKYQLRVETPVWIGQELFGVKDPAISRSLPILQEESSNLNEALIASEIEGFKNVDFWGYFQYHTKYYKPYKEYFCSLFQPIPEIVVRLREALDNLISQGKTLVGLHLRRGDYGYGSFFITPSEWYKSWLDGLWETLEEPILFIASDEPDRVRQDFLEYNPITAQDLGIELPQAEFYPDFYLLTQCDIVAISNSSFSFAACLLNEKAKFFFRPHLETAKLIPFDPWNSQVLFLDSEESSPRQAVEALEEISLSTVNLVIFPDWQQPEEVLSEDLEKVLRVILQHPDRAQIALLIEVSPIDKEDEAHLLLSSIIMNLLLEENLEVNEGPQISLLQQLSYQQWLTLLPQLSAKLALSRENKKMALKAANIRALTLDELARLSMV